MHSALRRLDLNLLIAFDALIRNRSVLAAADEIGMSPSAFSHALGRLRTALSDELFVRFGNAMQPTTYAVELAESVREALRILSDGLAGAQMFDPATSAQTFIFAATDFTAFAVLPRLIALLDKAAPDLRTKVVYSTRAQAFDDLSAGRVDFSLGFSEDALRAEGVEAFDCFEDDYVVAARQAHSRIEETLSLEDYLREKHVVVTPWSESSSVVNAALLRQGYRREVVVELPSLLAAPFIVGRTDHLITLPKLAAMQMAEAASLRIFPAPFEVAPYTLRVFFHSRHAGTSAHRWMRDQLQNLAKQMRLGLMR
ncbi:LysR family transcriptional regulator [Rhizobium sp. R72]|uniref:LysR substrate-binding domain-containing protein n=1 Tax=unclassified Rhizobium TaxID=2613769 RepID=UPI000B538592|nr:MULTISPECIES: LysR substrate-binding domain-containing protein [unclassified Rhizobium]OWW05293.1 LysR family transcriptional regulator [Rhizobium sp. R72]OWW06350.1 LysR family transcriptional regulator [Rhizobium sp. R711]